MSSGLSTGVTSVLKTPIAGPGGLGSNLGRLKHDRRGAVKAHLKFVSVCIYIYIYICIYVCIHRERERKKQVPKNLKHI